MKRALAMALLLSLALAVSSSAFNGKRKGIILGVGFGAAPYIHWSAQVQGVKFYEDRLGWGINALAGYGLDDRNILAGELNLVAYQSSIFDIGLEQGFGGLSWYHYFGPPGKSFFSVAGLGWYRFVPAFGTIYINISFDHQAIQPPFPSGAPTGTGYLLGGGYEFARHVQAAIYLAWGKPSSEYGQAYSNAQVNLVLTTVAF